MTAGWDTIATGSGSYTNKITSVGIFLLAFLALATVSAGVAGAQSVENVDQNQTYNTIQNAVDNATAGDTIEVGAGTYNETVTVDVQDLTLTAAAGDEPTIGDRVVILSSGTVFEGFEVSPPPAQSNGESEAVRVGSGSAGPDDVVIRNNVVRDFERNDSSGSFYGPDGINLFGGNSSDPIENAIVKNNEIRSIKNSDSFGAAAISVQGNILNTTVTNNNISDIGEQVTDYGFGVVIRGTGNHNEVPDDVSVTDNQINDVLSDPNTDTFGVGLEVEASGGSNYDFNNNTVDNIGLGVEIKNSASETTLEQNSISGNEAHLLDQSGNVDTNGVFNNNSFTPDAVFKDGSLVPETNVDVLNVDQNQGYDKVPNAVDNATAGDTLEISSGNYSFTNIVKDGLTLDGAGMDATNLSGNQLNIDATDVTLRDIELDAPGLVIDVEPDAKADGLRIENVKISEGANNGLRISANGTTENPVDKADGLYIDNYHVTNNTNKGIYLERATNATLKNITIEGIVYSNDAPPANGIDINLKYEDYENITIEDTVVSGVERDDFGNDPTWNAGIAIKARDDGSYAGTPATLDGVTLNNVTVEDSVAGLRFGEPGVNYSVNNGPTNVAVQNSKFKDNGEYHIEDLSGSVSLSSVLNDNTFVPGGTIDQETNQIVPDNVLNVDQNEIYDKIQNAVDNASAGDTIEVRNGTYKEQVVIDKNLTLRGESGARIASPTNREGFDLAESSSTYEPVVFAYGGSIDAQNNISGSGEISVDISGFEIDGQNIDPQDRSVGILLRNANANVSNNTIEKMLSPGGMETFGTLAYGNGTVRIVDNNVTDYERGGIGTNDDNGQPVPKAIIRNNRVSALNATPGGWAPNGIQLSPGTTGKVVNNTVLGNIGNDDPGGVVVFAAQDVLIKNNTLTNHDNGVQVFGDYFFGTGLDARNVTVTDNEIEESKSGIVLASKSTDVTVSENQITNNTRGINIALQAGDLDNANIDNNNFSENDVGINAAESGSGGNVTNTDILNNEFLKTLSAYVSDRDNNLNIGSIEQANNFDEATVEFKNELVPESQVNTTLEVNTTSTNSPVKVNSTLQVDVNVTNTGGEPGSQEVELRDFNGTVVDNRTTSQLGFGDSEQFTLFWMVGESDVGTDDISVATQNDTDNTTVTVNPLDNPFFEVNVTGTDSPVLEGDILSVNSTIENTGDIQDTQGIDLRDFGGNLEDTSSITLNGSESENVTLEWITDSADVGERTVSVESVNDTATENVLVLQELTGCTVISSSGLYGLGQDIQGQNTCIEVQASNVTLYGLGNTVSGNSPNPGTNAILVNGSENVTVSDLTVQDWTSGVAAVRYENADNGRIQNVTVRNNDAGVEIANSSGVDISDSSLPNNNITIVGTSRKVQNLEVDDRGTRVSFEANDVTLGEAASVPENTEAEGIGRAFNATNLTDSSYLNVTLNYTDQDAIGVREESLSIWEYDEGTDTWTELDSTVDTVSNTLQANTTNFSTFAAQGNKSGNITLDNVSGIPGENVTVPLTSSGDNIAGYQANVTFDTSVVNVTNITEVDTTSWSTTENVQNGGGYLSVTGSNSSGLQSPHLLNVTFKIDETATAGDVANLTFKPSETTLNDEDELVNTTVNNGSVSVLKPANFSVNITGTNEPVEEGDTLNVTAEVNNTGDVQDTQNVTLDLNRSVGEVDNTTITLGGGNSTTTTLQWDTTGETPDDYLANVSSEDDSDTANVTVLQSPTFNVTITGTDSPVVEGGKLNVTAEINNTGEVQGTQNVTLDLNQSVGEVDNTTITLSGGANTTTTLQWNTSVGQDGDYLANVSSEDDSDTANVTVLAQASFNVTITGTNSPVVEGETLNVTADVNNTGDLQDTQNVTLDLNRSVGEVNNTTITLSGGANTTTTLQWNTTGETPDDYLANVSSEDDSDTAAVTVLAEAEFVVAIENENSPVVENDSVTGHSGGTLNVTTNVTNVGEVSETQTVTLDVPSEGLTDVDNVTLTLSGGSSQTENLSWSPANGEVNSQTVNASSNDSFDTAGVFVCRPGDANANGFRSSLDGTYILQDIVGVTPFGDFYSNCADATDDGTVATDDVTLLQRVIVGLEG